MSAARSNARRRRQRELVLPIAVRSTRPFRFDACLRIAGIGERHAEIERKTGLRTPRSHRRGDPRGKSRSVWAGDLWLLESPLSEDASLDEHADWLWKAVQPHQALFADVLAQASWSDLCLGCRSESGWPVIGVRAQSLDLTRELRIGVSFNFTCL